MGHSHTHAAPAHVRPSPAPRPSQSPPPCSLLPLVAVCTCAWEAIRAHGGRGRAKDGRTGWLAGGGAGAAQPLLRQIRRDAALAGGGNLVRLPARAGLCDHPQPVLRAHAASAGASAATQTDTAQSLDSAGSRGQTGRASRGRAGHGGPQDLYVECLGAVRAPLLLGTLNQCVGRPTPRGR